MARRIFASDAQTAGTGALAFHRSEPGFGAKPRRQCPKRSLKGHRVWEYC
jgi:hypothetical protein